MTVQELIVKLEDIENKDLPIFVYDENNSEIYPVNSVDNTIGDRVDINFSYYERW